MFVYRYELRGIQAFVLRSSKLREIAAASGLVAAGLDAARARLVPAHNGTTLMHAAGSATITFPTAADARGFAEVWPVLVHELVPGPEFVAAIAPANDLRTMTERLGQARNRPTAPAFDAGPLVARAARSGRPAVGRRRGVANDAIHSVLARHHGDRSLEERLLEGTRHHEAAFLATELPGSGYLALLHADGNGVGRHVLDHLQSGNLNALQAFSKALSTATITSVQRALEAEIKPTHGVLPVRPVVVGGDDVTLLLRSDDARAFTVHYLEAFEEACDADPVLAGLKLTASAGVVYAKQKAPFHAVLDTCEELVRWVKASSGRKASAFAIHRVTESPLESYKDARIRSLSAPGVPDALCGGPYLVGRQVSAPSAADLDDVVAALGGLPRGTLREWLRVSLVDPNRAGLRWNRIAEVQRHKNGDAWSRLARHLNQGNWQRGSADQRTRSPLLDAINLTRLERARPGDGT